MWEKTASPRGVGRGSRTIRDLFIRALASHLVVGKPVLGAPELFHKLERSWTVMSRTALSNGLLSGRPDFCNRDNRFCHQSAALLRWLLHVERIDVFSCFDDNDTKHFSCAYQFIYE